MTSFYALICSLPHHSRQFKVKQTPISRIQLEKRLKQLSDDEKQLVSDVEVLLYSSWFNSSLSFEQTLLLADKRLRQKNEFIKELIHWFFDCRSLLVALRLRNMKQPLPKNTKDYWLTRWNRRIINNWNLPDFGLQNIYPWLSEINKQITNNQPDAVEEILLTQLWKHLDRVQGRHYFDIEAVIIYILRWDIVNYWSQFNEVTGVQRLEDISNHIIHSNQLLDESL